MQLSDSNKCLSPLNHYEGVTIGITGGIGSGKSVVSRILRCNGFEVYDCDSEARKLMRYEKRVVDALVSILGDQTYDRYGNLNKKHIADSIFNDSKIRIAVNGIVHKAVRDDIMKKRDCYTGLFFIETAIMSTSRLDSFCDQIWLVETPDERRIQRLAIRDGLSEKEIAKRFEVQERELLQLPQNKVVVIENGESNSLLTRIMNLLNKNIQTC